MGIRKIYEAELDGPSVIVWEAGVGTRVIFPTEQMAVTAAEYLVSKANQFHIAKGSNSGNEDENMISVLCYGDQQMTEFQFIQNYLNRVRKLGYKLDTTLVRQTGEYW